MKTTIKLFIVALVLAPAGIFAQNPTSYDSDGDGIPDSIDECMYVKGVKQYQGCPFEKKSTTADRDGDGITNEADGCPDLFGTADNKGCPDMGQGKKDISYYGASYGVDPTAEASSSPTMFTTTSTSEQTELLDFKESIRLTLADSKNSFNDIKGEHYYNGKDSFTTTNCLPGAKDCYLRLGDKKIYYADFGSYRNGIIASEKSDDLKRKLLMSLGETEWHYSVLGKSGYVEEYQVWKKTDSTRYSRVRTYVEKTGDRYKVYLTIEEI